MIDYKNLTQSVIEGEKDPLESYCILTDLKKDIEKCIDEIKNQAIEEAKKNGKTFEKFNYEITVVNGRKIFNYKNMPEWNKINEEKQDLEKRANLAHDLSQRGLYEKGKEINDPETGEIFNLPSLPELTFGTDYITFKKLKVK